MTVTANDSRVQHNGNGSTTVFAYDFKILDQTHIKVVKTNTSGVDTTQTITTHYTVSGVGNSGGGNITMLTAPASGEKLTFLRNVPLSQETDYTEGGAFPAESHEAALDKLTMIAQQLAEVNARTVTLSASADLSTVSTALPAPDASKVLAWNSGETALENVENPAVAAAASATAAATSATNSASSATASASSATSSANSATASANSATASAASATTASNAVAIVQTPLEFAYTSTTPPAIGDGAAYITIPARMNGMIVTAVEAEFINTVATGSVTTIQIHNQTLAQDILSTKLTIDAGERSSATAATPAVINTSYDNLTTGDLIRLDIDGVGSSTAGTGLVVRLLCGV